MNRYALRRALHAALTADDPDAVRDVEPADRRDRSATLLQVYALHLAPLPDIGARVRHQHHPAVAALKQRLEAAWLAELDELTGGPEAAGPPEAPGRPAGSEPAGAALDALRALAARTRLPAVYGWLAHEADRSSLERFLALEGGPDGGFDDLVAACQLGLTGATKLELAHNYWDEMGRGAADSVHTLLHRQLVDALELAPPPLDEQPVSALERAALCGLLATNRWLQPEMLGALGLIELQAGPRCRLVLQAFDRLGLPAAAYPFYAVHAETDPRHGRDWLAGLAPLLAEQPDWGPRVLRGARWRQAVDAAFLADALAELAATRAA